jgi:hypothetical protein
VGKVLVPDQIRENILFIKVAVILIAISLFISSLALLILALSRHRFQKPIDLSEFDLSPDPARISDPEDKT